MNKLDLGTRLSDCPKCWQNFILELQKKFKNPYRDVAMSRIQQELKCYGARYRLAGSNPTDYIEFESESSLTMFVLRWS